MTLISIRSQYSSVGKLTRVLPNKDRHNTHSSLPQRETHTCVAPRGCSRQRRRAQSFTHASPPFTSLRFPKCLRNCRQPHPAEIRGQQHRAGTHTGSGSKARAPGKARAGLALLPTPNCAGGGGGAALGKETRRDSNQTPRWNKSARAGGHRGGRLLPPGNGAEGEGARREQPGPGKHAPSPARAGESQPVPAVSQCPGEEAACRGRRSPRSPAGPLPPGPRPARNLEGRNSAHPLSDGGTGSPSQLSPQHPFARPPAPYLGAALGRALHSHLLPRVCQLRQGHLPRPTPAASALRVPATQRR